jgi:trimethylamine--corrinoid protein Co-methyltransferase
MKLQSKDVAFRTPQFRKLSDDQLAHIHHASLEILDRTGVCLYHQEALDLLARAGVRPVEGNRVRIPPALVEWAIAAAPKRIVLCDRQGNRVLPLARSQVFFGPGSDCPYVLDYRTGERRLGTLQDIVEGIRVCDALPDIDFLMSLNIASDVEQRVADRHQMRAMLMNSTKPILFVTTAFEGCVDAVAMAEAVAGGAEALRRDPRCACYVNVTGPLRHNQEALQKLLFMAEKGLPTTYTPVVLRGINGPVTLAGATALANAGELVGLVLAQLQREGAPVIHSGGYGDMVDMRSLVSLYAAPESQVVRGEMVRAYDLPAFGMAGASDAKLPDAQAAAESALSLLLETLSGANLVHDVGYLESGKCYSLEHLVICHELIGYVKRFMAETRVDAETLALDVIDAVGPHGDFLSTDHTLRHYKEDWYPALFDRNNFENWSAAGAKSLRERARERVEQVVADHRPAPLPQDVQARIDAIVEQA